ncbi:MAG: hypothetical protein JO166_12055, partial [Deltaproteobacteria bacterium]|nr:hypothetical protein [Deltaproteobacteria bacterium]
MARADDGGANGFAWVIDLPSADLQDRSRMELPRTLHHIADWLHLSTPAGRVVAQNLAIWAIAGGLVWYISRGLSFKQTIRTLE